MLTKSVAGRTSSTVTVFAASSAVMPTVAGSVVVPGQVRGGTLDVDDERGQRRGRLRVDDPEPAALHVRGAQRAAVGEGQVRTHVERDLAAAVGEGPRRGQCRLEVQVGVVGRQRLEELGHDRRAAGVTLDRRIERIGRAGQDLDRPIRPCRGRRRACPDQRRKQGQAEEHGEGATHRAEYTFGSVGGPFRRHPPAMSGPLAARYRACNEALQVHTAGGTMDWTARPLTGQRGARRTVRGEDEVPRQMRLTMAA